MTGPPLVRERVLMVDDDANLLAGYQRQLRKLFAVQTALGGEAGLAAIEQNGPWAVVISDMRMPGMDGVQFLSQVRRRSPSTVRMMLTGNADQQTAIEAVNEGNIFRFLTKPCSPEQLVRAIQAGLKQHRLIMAERVLLEQTLNGAIGILAEVLGIVHPVAFSRAGRLRRIVGHLAAKLQVKGAWQYEAAALLAQIGYVVMPPDTLARLEQGEPLSPEETRMLERAPEVARRLIGMIPRLETVADMVANQGRAFADFPAVADGEERAPADLGGQMLRAAMAYDRLVAAGMSPPAALSALRREVGQYEPTLLAHLSTLEPEDEAAEIRPLGLHEVQAGMLIHENIYARNGLLLVAKGQPISPPMLERLLSFHQGMGIVEPVLVRVPRAPAPAAEVITPATPPDSSNGPDGTNEPDGRNRSDGSDRSAGPATAPASGKLAAAPHAGAPGSMEDMILNSLGGFSARQQRDR